MTPKQTVEKQVVRYDEIDIEQFMPSYISLYYVDYRDDLSENIDILQECIENNNLYPIYEKICDWWDFPEEHYLDDIEKEIKDYFYENGDEDGLIDGKDADEYYKDHCDDIREYLWDNDESTPVEDLLSNTGKVTFFYDLGHECEHGWNEAFMCSPWRDKEPDDVFKECAEILGILPDTPEERTLEEIVNMSSYGGQLRIYFAAKIKDVLSNEGYTENDTDFETITFNGEFNIGIYNPGQGAGWVDSMKLNRTFKFNRDNLHLSKTDHYSWESCAGTFDNWCEDYDEPTFSYEELEAVEVGESENKALREQEAQYIKIYKSGGCTAGDMDITRHRDVYYRNEIPCGNKCPHCGTFWID